MSSANASASSSSAPTSTVLVYSDDAAVRERIRIAVGRRPASDVGRVQFVEAASEPEVIKFVDAGGIDVCILDGEAWPAGGLGISRQIKDEIRDCPATVVVVGRRDDRWLAAWSRCDGVLSHPLDAIEAADVVADVLRTRAGRLPAPR